DLLLGFAQGGVIGKGFRHGLAGHAASEAELRVMSRVVAFGAVAGRFAAAAHDRGKGAGSQITQAKELLQELGSFGFQSIDIVRHKGFLSVPQIVCTYIDVQNNVTKKEIPQDGTSMSLTHRRKSRVATTQWRTPPRFSKLMASRNGQPARKRTIAAGLVRLGGPIALECRIPTKAQPSAKRPR